MRYIIKNRMLTLLATVTVVGLLAAACAGYTAQLATITVRPAGHSCVGEHRETRRRCATASTAPTTPLALREEGRVGWCLARRSIGIGVARRGKRGERRNDGQSRRQARQSEHGSSQHLV